MLKSKELNKIAILKVDPINFTIRNKEEQQGRMLSPVVYEITPSLSSHKILSTQPPYCLKPTKSTSISIPNPAPKKVKHPAPIEPTNLKYLAPNTIKNIIKKRP